MSQPPTRKLGKYEIRRDLGKGAMGVVYLAYDPVLEREVALKVMNSAIVSDEDLKQRFEREAKAVARLQHPNIVTVYDLGYDEEGAPFIAMEYLKGTDLERRIRKDAPSFSEKLEIIAQVCRGLGHAHHNGIIHRDVKPANIVVTEGGDVKIMDFGVARWTQSSQTQTGAILGTADYMSPEQIRGQRVDGRSDIFAVGVILYRLLTKKKPFAGENINAVFFKILNADPPELLLPDGKEIPELQAIVDRALAKNPDDRYATAEEMAEDIRAFLRVYEGSLSGDTVFETIYDPGAFVDHDTSQGSGRGTRSPGARTVGSGGSGSGSISRTYRPTPGTGAPPTLGGVSGGTVSGRTAAGRTVAPPTAIVPGTRVVRPGVRVAAPAPQRSRWPLAMAAVVVLGLGGAGGYYYYLGSRTPAPGPTTASGPGSSSASSPTPVDLEGRFTFTEQLIDSGRYAQAFDSVENILSLSPGNARALELKERIQNALEERQEAPAPEPPPPPPKAPATPPRPAGPTPAERAQAMAADAALAIAEGNVDRASELVAQGQGLDPSNARWGQLRRQIEEKRRELEQREAAASRERVVSTHLRSAAASIERGDYDAAIEAFDRVLEQDPNNAAAVSGKTQALLLKKQAEAPSGPARQIVRSKTEYVPAPGKQDGPRGFQSGGGVQVKRATAAPEFPAELIVELNPENVQPGNPFVLRVRLHNQGNVPIFVKSLEVAWTYGGKTTGKGAEIPSQVERVNARGTAVLHEVGGTWNEDRNQGSITATVRLADESRLVKTIRW